MDHSPKQFRKRNAILSALQQTKAHPSADELHQLLQEHHPDISLATVYRNLSLFKSQGIIASLGTVAGIERFDANTAPHVHFICTDCQAVIDLPELKPPEVLCATAAESVGGQVDSCQLSFTGLCGDCVQKGRMDPAV